MVKQVGALLACAAMSNAASAQVTLKSDPVVSGLASPVWIGSAPGDTGRLFVLEQRTNVLGVNRGRIRIITLPSSLAATPFWTSPQVPTGGEQGLLGLAFHPNYASNGRFYVNYTRADGDTVIAEGSVSGDPNIANATANTILVIDQPASNHNGGWLGFGPDGYLYIAMGDGGGANDNQLPSGSTTGNAQDLTNNLLGKILRIDIDGLDNIPGTGDEDAFPADANRNYSIPPTNPFVANGNDDEIWAYGVRNPWRCDFDEATGNLWVADVGQNVREEISVIEPGDGPYNLGWRCFEGTRATGLGCSNNPNPIPPILEYGHSVTVPPTTILGCSITGGVVYRGSSMPCLQGTYIFADYCSGDIWTMTYDESVVGNITNRTAQLDPAGAPAISNVICFGQDGSGEMYVGDQSGGEVFKISLNCAVNASNDCNENGVADACDICTGTSPDRNNNGEPDECGLPFCNDLDFNNDEVFPDSLDVTAFIDVFGGTPCPTCDPLDFNNDLVFPDSTDLTHFLFVFGAGQCPVP